MALPRPGVAGSNPAGAQTYAVQDVGSAPHHTRRPRRRHRRPTMRNHNRRQTDTAEHATRQAIRIPTAATQPTRSPAPTATNRLLRRKRFGGGGAEGVGSTACQAHHRMSHRRPVPPAATHSTIRAQPRSPAPAAGTARPRSPACDSENSAAIKWHLNPRLTSPNARPAVLLGQDQNRSTPDMTLRCSEASSRACQPTGCSRGSSYRQPHEHLPGAGVPRFGARVPHPTRHLIYSQRSAAPTGAITTREGVPVPRKLGRSTRANPAPT